MADRFDILTPRPARPVRSGRVEGDRQVGRDGAPGAGAPGEFARVLDEVARQGGRLKFSAHAVDRLQSRGIGLGIEDMRKVEEAMDRLDAKGGRQGLVILEGAALVVSVDSRTVITAVDPADEDGRVFTNIDSAVLVKK